MIKRLFTATCVTAVLILVWGAGAPAHDLEPRPFTDLWAFGDSLTDTGNLFSLTGDVEPPSPPYFNGRFSNGPVWIESLALLLDLLDVDFATRNQAIGGAFTDTRGETLDNTGVFTQVANFVETGQRIGDDDLVVVWAGANNYFGGDTDPEAVVENLVRAIEALSEVGAERFLVPNLPNLGDTPGGIALGAREALNALTGQHNAELAEEMEELRDELDVEIVILDVNAAFEQMLEDPQIFGFDNVSVPCLIQNPAGTRTPTGVCPALGDSFDATDKLFWDLIHP
ncbi:MAG: SGNH/GDSL hydrolase family protein, partial [Paracoccaceae bacterium]